MASPSRQCAICGSASQGGQLFNVKSVAEKGVVESEEKTLLRVRRTKDYLAAMSELRPELKEEQKGLKNVRICSKHFANARPAPLNRPDLVDWVPTKLLSGENKGSQQPQPLRPALVPLNAKRSLERRLREGKGAQQSRPAPVVAAAGIPSNIMLQNAVVGMPVLAISPMPPKPPTVTQVVQQPAVGDRPDPLRSKFSLALEAAVSYYLPALQEGPPQIQAAPIQEPLEDNQLAAQLFSLNKKWIDLHSTVQAEAHSHQPECMVLATKLMLLGNESEIPSQDRKKVEDIPVTEENVSSGNTMAYARLCRELLLELKTVKEEISPTVATAAPALSKTDKNRRIVGALKAHFRRKPYSSLFDELSTDSTTNQ